MHIKATKCESPDFNLSNPGDSNCSGIRLREKDLK